MLMHSYLCIDNISDVFSWHFEGFFHNFREASHDTIILRSKLKHVFDRQFFKMGHVDSLNIDTFDLGTFSSNQVSDMPAKSWSSPC